MEFLLTISILCGLYFYFRVWGNRAENQIKDLERKVYAFRGLLAEPYTLLGEDESSEARKGELADLNNIEVQYFALKNKFRHNENRLIQYAEYFYEYTYALWEMRSATEQVMVGSDNYGWDDWEEDVRDARVTIHEVERRFREALGKEE